MKRLTCYFDEMFDDFGSLYNILFTADLSHNPKHLLIYKLKKDFKNLNNSKNTLKASCDNKY